MKKIIKTFLVFILVCTFIVPVKADETNSVSKGELAQNAYNDYTFYENVYKLIGAISYYHDHAAVFDAQNSNSEGNAVTSKQKEALVTAMNVFKITGVTKNALMEVYQKYETAASSNNSVTDFVNGLFELAGQATFNFSNESGRRDAQTFHDQFAKFGNLGSMFKYAKNRLSAQLKTIENLCSDNSITNAGNACVRVSSTSTKLDITKKYENLIEDTIKSYSSFCDKLSDSPGISYYLSSAIKIISYVSLALAVILGALDFVKAITSQDDAALKKAFQLFSKRLVAVVLIFLSYVIVKTVLGLVTKIPLVNTEQLEICNELKLNGIKGFTTED